MAILTYLASPYSHPDPAIRKHRTFIAARVAALMFDRGDLVIPAIPMGVSIVGHTASQASDWDTWAKLDRELIARCDAVAVICMPGWEDSKGVQAEIEIARQLDKLVIFVDEMGYPMEP